MFVEKYGKKIRRDVSLFVADGKKFGAKYCSDKHLLINLKNLVHNYQIKEKYFIFFNYIGNSCFYLSIFSTWGFDICNQIREKFLLKDLIGEALMETKKEDVFMSDNCVPLGEPMGEISNALQGIILIFNVSELK